MNETTIIIPTKKDITYTCHDGVARQFSSYTIPDLRRLTPSLLFLNSNDLWLAFLFAGGPKPLAAGAVAEVADDGSTADDQYEQLLKFITPLFEAKYCSDPLTRDQIENGDHIDLQDLKILIDIALGNAGNDQKVSEQ